MRVIIAGSRGIASDWGRELLLGAIEIARTRGIEITELVCGRARNGMDHYSREWAKENGIPVKTFGSDYEGRRIFGGYVRNEEIAEYGEALIAISNGTVGTEHMAQLAKAKGLPGPA